MSLFKGKKDKSSNPAEAVTSDMDKQAKSKVKKKRIITAVAVVAAIAVVGAVASRFIGPSAKKTQTGEVQYDENGLMTRGTIIRHLVLPGCTGDSLKVLDWIHDNMSASTPVSIMRQYTPLPFCTVKGLDRRVTDSEYERVVDHALDLKLNALTQEKEAAETSYIPDFDLR